MMKWAVACALLHAACAVAQQQDGSMTMAPAMAPTAGGDCSRTSILAAIEAEPTLSTVTTAIKALNVTSIIPDKEGPGTIFLPKDEAFAALGVSPMDLIKMSPDKLAAILAYHSLIGGGKTLNRKALVAGSPLNTDLGIVSRAAGGTNSYTIMVKPGPGRLFGRESVSGNGKPQNTGLIRGVIKKCGLYIYPIGLVLIPTSTLNTTPSNLGKAILTAGAATTTGASAGLAAAVASGAVKVPAGAAGPVSGPASGPASGAAAGAGAGAASGPGSGAAASGPGSGAAAAGGAMAPNSAPAAGVEGQALPLLGAGGSLTTKNPVLLTGNVTSKDGSEMLGPGLVYLDGAVTDGEGVSGKATEVANLTMNGVELGPKSIDLKGAMVTGFAFDAEDLMTTAAPPMAMGPASGPGSGGPGMAPASGPGAEPAPAGFAEPLMMNPDGTFSTTPDMGPFLFDGNVTGGKALDAKAATGKAAKGSLGPGSVYVDGTVKNSKGVSGKAYPVVSLTGDSIAVNRDNGIDIKGANFMGTAYNATGIMPKLQPASGPGGSGAASSGSPGANTGGAGINGKSGSAASSPSASGPPAAGPGTDMNGNPTAAPTSAAPASPILSLAAFTSAAAAVLLALA